MMKAQGGSVQLEQRQPNAIFALRWRSAIPVRAGKGKQDPAPAVDKQEGVESDGQVDEGAGLQSEAGQHPAIAETASRA